MNFKLLFQGIIVLFPFACIFLWTEHALWLQVSIVTICTLMMAEKLELTIFGVLLYGLAIITGFYLLFLTAFHPLLFILACILMASSTILITAKGEKFRVLGKWYFIPSIILAIEMTEYPPFMGKNSIAILPYLLFALVPTLIFIGRKQEKRVLYPLTLLKDFGEITPFIDSLMAIILAAGISSALVEFFGLPHGQWLIWGAASVVTGDVATSPRKFWERFLAVIISVPIGVFLGYLIPQNAINLTIITMAIYLSFVGFKTYQIAYTLRCLFVTIAVTLVTHSAAAALERMLFVVIGGIIGLACVFSSYYLHRTYQNRQSHKD